MLIVKYNRINFFGHNEYTEDRLDYFDKKQLEKAFRFLSKNGDVAVQVNEDVIFWNCLSDFNNGIITVRRFSGMSYDEYKASFDKVKKDYYSKM